MVPERGATCVFPLGEMLETIEKRSRNDSYSTKNSALDPNTAVQPTHADNGFTLRVGGKRRAPKWVLVELEKLLVSRLNLLELFVDRSRNGSYVSSEYTPDLVGHCGWRGLVGGFGGVVLLLFGWDRSWNDP